MVRFDDSGGDGPPLLLVHGFPLDRSLWKEQVALREVARVISFDLPGFGEAPPPEGPPSMAAYADAVVAILDAARLERAALCGLSMGGYVLFELWRRHPERVDRLVFCDTRADADPPAGKQARLAAIEQVRLGRRANLLDGLAPRLLAATSLAKPHIVEVVRMMGRRSSDAGLIAALRALHDRPDSTPTLRTVRAPTLVVVGAQDALTPPAVARVIHEGIAGSALVEIPDAGHLSPLENPGAFNAALREFLSEGSGETPASARGTLPRRT
jgi:pimeloyl-ACP methyl ester carboxylesterase